MNIEVIAFDADDTLWSNEPFFQETERKYETLLSAYGAPATLSSELFKTEMENLERFGYGAKGFTLSMIETALRISQQQVSAEVIQEILVLGKSLLDMPIELLPGVEEALRELSSKGRYRLVVATKGDLVDQQRKLERSGIASYFEHVEIMAEKTEREYGKLIDTLQVRPDQFVMVGNSLKSDIQPVLNQGGWAIHVPFEVMWKHEVADEILHPRLSIVNTLAALPNLIPLIKGG